MGSFAKRARLHAGLLWEYFLQYLKVRVGYRGDFLVSIATSTAATVFAFAFVVILFKRVTPAALALPGNCISLRFLADSLRLL